MANLKDFRQQHPEYNDMDDATLSDALYKKYYSDMPRDRFDTIMGNPKTTVGSPVPASGGPPVPLPEGWAPPIAQPQTTDEWLGIKRGIKIPLDNAALALDKGARAIGIPVDAIAGGLNKLTGGLISNKSASQIRDDDIKYIQHKQDQGVHPGALGEMAGSTVANLPALAVTRNPFLLGGVGGALSTEADNPRDAAIDTATGAAFGKVGDVGVRSLGAVVAPQVRGTVNTLLQRGVKLTPGQIVGGSLHKVEDAATSSLLPFVSDAQNRSLESFNKAVVNEGLGPIGSKLPDNVRAGHDSIDFAQREFDKAYDSVLPNLTLKKDPTFIQDSTNLRNLAQNLPRDYANRFNNLFNEQINKRFSQPGYMSGETMKEVEEELRHEISNYTGQGSTPTDRNYADAVRELRAQVRDLAQRSNPRYAAALKNINAGYALLTRAETAAAGSKGGIFTPNAYRRAVVGADGSVRRRQAAAGNALGQELAIAGEDVLPRTIPESGTIPRAIVNGVTAGAVFGASKGYVPHVNPMMAGAVGLALTPYTKLGQKAASVALTKRPPGANVVRRGLQASAPIASIAEGSNAVRHRDDNLSGAYQK